MLIHDEHFTVARCLVPHVARVAIELREAAAPEGGTSVWAVDGLGVAAPHFVLSRDVSSLDDLVTGQATIEAALDRLRFAGAPPSRDPAGSGLAHVLAAHGRLDGCRVLAIARLIAADGTSSTATDWSIDAFHHLTTLSGASGTLTRTVAGPIGAIGWRFGFDTPEAVATMDARVGADATWLELVESAAGLFVPGASSRSIATLL